MSANPGRLLPSRWLEALEKGLLDDQFTENLGHDWSLLAEHKALVEQALRGFLERFGNERTVVIVRSPGRINLIGMHVDHRGGSVNPIGVKETVAVAAPREDDRVSLVNANPQFGDRSFSISGELPAAPVTDWDDWTAGNLTELSARGLAGDWSNYARAAGCYLANWFWLERDRPPSSFRGLDAFVSSNMPMAVGMSSSSVLVVSLARLFILFNSLEIDDQALIDHCGTAEWYVGTRGGKGDHAAIIQSRQGHITHLDFFPFAVRYLSFPRDYRIVVCNSMVLSRKSATTRHAFNERIASYGIAFLLFRKIAAGRNLDDGRLKMLRDVNPDNLGLGHRELARLLLELPESIGRQAVGEELGPGCAETLRKLWQTHPEPESGYPIRDVCLFGVSECLRSRMAAELLEQGRIEDFGHLMNISHDGDRVCRWRQGIQVPWRRNFTEELYLGLPHEMTPLHLQPGGYRVSTPEIDFLVDLALSVEGVLGARLTGAGYGGCVAVLARVSAVRELLARLEKEYYAPREKPLQAEVCQPLAGSGFFRI